MNGKWQVVERSLTDTIRHEQVYDTRRLAEDAAAQRANQLSDNDLTEVGVEEIGDPA